MKNFFIAVTALCCLTSLQSQSLLGAWEAQLAIPTGTASVNLRNVVIFTKEHQVSAIYDAQTGAFITTNGGSYNYNGTTVTETIEFDTNTPERVGTTVTFTVELSENELRIKGKNLVWKRIDDGKPGALAGAWLMSGRKRDGEIQKRDTSGPRKTMKILSGTRFQWIAYHTANQQFMGAGGGTYTTVYGQYTENIEFFSRDDSRVGASLQFDYDLVDGDWHHSGLSSKGEPIYEVWSMR